MNRRDLVPGTCFWASSPERLQDHGNTSIPQNQRIQSYRCEIIDKPRLHIVVACTKHCVSAMPFTTCSGNGILGKDDDFRGAHVRCFPNGAQPTYPLSERHKDKPLFMNYPKLPKDHLLALRILPIYYKDHVSIVQDARLTPSSVPDLALYYILYQAAIMNSLLGHTNVQSGDIARYYTREMQRLSAINDKNDPHNLERVAMTGINGVKGMAEASMSLSEDQIKQAIYEKGYDEGCAASMTDVQCDRRLQAAVTQARQKGFDEGIKPGRWHAQNEATAPYGPPPPQVPSFSQGYERSSHKWPTETQVNFDMTRCFHPMQTHDPKHMHDRSTRPHEAQDRSKKRKLDLQKELGDESDGELDPRKEASKKPRTTSRARPVPRRNKAANPMASGLTRFVNKVNILKK